MKLKYSLSALVLAAAAGAATAEDDPAVARTVEQVKMLDALYKTAVVLITEHYVENPSSISAATASKLLFAEMKKNGFHEVRLLGLTDHPGESVSGRRRSRRSSLSASSGATFRRRSSRAASCVR